LQREKIDLEGGGLEIEPRVSPAKQAIPLSYIAAHKVDIINISTEMPIPPHK
jgi:hypothetical protein